METPAQSPSRGARRFADGIADEGAVRDSGKGFGEEDVPMPSVGHVLVDLIGDYVCSVLEAQIDDRFQLVVTEHLPGGIVRRVQHERPRGLLAPPISGAVVPSIPPQSPLQFLDVERPRPAVRVLPERHVVGFHPKYSGLGRVQFVVRLERDDAISGRADRPQGRCDGLGRAEGHGDVVGIDLVIVHANVVVRYGGSEIGSAHGGGILVQFVVGGTSVVVGVVVGVVVVAPPPRGRGVLDRGGRSRSSSSRSYWSSSRGRGRRDDVVVVLLIVFLPIRRFRFRIDIDIDVDTPGPIHGVRSRDVRGARFRHRKNVPLLRQRRGRGRGRIQGGVLRFHQVGKGSAVRRRERLDSRGEGAASLGFEGRGGRRRWR
mmetsp:Transcript_3246/g.7069  ORF Transcript_3246/g.7069 Transcript_3246/m.7069 type:complete len:373 (-) Transcript_3246:185-1303(-)